MGKSDIVHCDNRPNRTHKMKPRRGVPGRENRERQATAQASLVEVKYGVPDDASRLAAAFVQRTLKGE
jgi:hypothetical protein